MGLSTEALARTSARRPWVTIGIWIVIIAVAVGLNVTLLADALTTEFGFSNDPDSIKGERLMEDRLLGGPRQPTEVMIVQSQTLTVDDQAFKDRVEQLYQKVLALGTSKIEGGEHYYLTGEESLVSQDRRTTILLFTMAGDLKQATEDAEELLDFVREASGQDGFKVLVSGEASVAAESNELTANDIEQGEKVGIPAAGIILLVLFGAVVAAIIPLALAIISIVVALGAVAFLGQLFELIFFVTLMITMIGLAVGIDYSLIIVSRFREELRRGRDKTDAVARTGATAGRTVLFSGAIVVTALAGLLVVPSTVFQALGIGAILVVLAAVLVSLTMLPAVLSLLGHRVNALRVPFVGRRLERSAQESSGGFLTWMVRTVMRHPVIGLVLVSGVLIAAASPFWQMKTGLNGVDSFPDGTIAKEAYLILEDKLSFGVVSPVNIVVDGDVNSAAVRDGMRSLQDLLRSDPDFVGEPMVQNNDAGDLALISIPIRGEFSSDQAVDAVKRLRKQYVPQSFKGVDAEVLVTGITAFNLDFFDIVDGYTPVVFVVVLGLSFLLLMVAFRSIVIPVKAIIMNLLSVGAAYGLLVLVFQKGVGADLLGFQQTEIIDAWIPLFLFSVLFGLSMDYHVFIMSRIRERYDETNDNAGAVAYGLRATAGLITGAALIMVAVFGGFATGDFVANQQFGFGLAVAILIDATLVRSVLVPSLMRLLGTANWYFPSWLNWVPDLRVEVEEPAGAAESGD
jgi:RND superfamily putative drug exporter